MEQFVITITRQFGSMGRPIARHLSELLGIEYYDRGIVDMVAKETNLTVSTISDVEERSSENRRSQCRLRFLKSRKRSFWNLQKSRAVLLSDDVRKVSSVRKKI